MATFQEILNAKYTVVQKQEQLAVMDEQVKLNELFSFEILAWAKSKNLKTFKEITSYSNDLRLGGYRLKSIKGLKYINKINELHLYGNFLNEIDISHFTDLRVVVGSNSGLRNIGSLSFCLSLTYLNLKDNNLSEIGTLNNSTGLITVFLENNNLTSVGSVLNLTSVTQFRISGNNLSTPEVDRILNEFNIIKNNGGAISTIYLSGNGVPTNSANNVDYQSLVSQGVNVSIQTS